VSSGAADVAEAEGRDNRSRNKQAQEAAAAAPEPVPATPREIEPADLPEIVSGLRIRQMTPFGNMHVKITVDPREQPRARGLRPARQGRRRRQLATSKASAAMASLWLRSRRQPAPRHQAARGHRLLTADPHPGRPHHLAPDGLACALKKYNSKPRSASGCAALLLGEVNLSELDQPSPPHRKPNAAPLDRRPVGTAPSVPTNGGHSGGSHAGRATQNVATVSAAQSTIRETTNVTQLPAAAPAPARTTTVAKHNGNGNGNGQHGQTTATITEVATETAVATLTAQQPATETRSEVRAQASQSLATVLGEVQHRHNAASHYKVVCQECGGTLMQQEGCQKCANCGYSAC
jgi:hypothetical protein